MKKINYLVSAALIVAMASCSGSKKPEAEYVPARESEKDQWGLVNVKTGEFVLANEFKDEPTAVVNGYFNVPTTTDNYETYYTVYKMGEKPEEVKGLEKLYAAGMMNEGLMPVTQMKEGITVVDKNGEVKFALDSKITECAPNFQGGLLLVKNEDGKWGFVDKNGETIIAPTYSDLYYYSDNGLAVAKKTNDKYETTTYLIDKNGEEVVKLKDDIKLLSTEFDKKGYLLASDKDHRYGFVDKNGEFFRLDGKVKGISVNPENTKYFAFYDGEGWGVMTYDVEKPEQVIKGKYESARVLDGDKFLVNDKKNYLIVNKNDDKKIEFKEDYKNVSPAPEGAKYKYRALDGSNRIFLDGDGNPYNKQTFSSVDFIYPGNVTSNKESKPASTTEDF